MKFCVFGIYNPSYARNRIMLSGMLANGCEIVECRVDPGSAKGLKKYWLLFQKARKLKRTQSFDAVLVAFPGQSVVWLARILFRKPIIFDAFLSLYDSNVFDRKLYTAKSLRGIKYFLLDWYSCKLAHAVLVDTTEHISYFEKTFHVKKQKLFRVAIGADSAVFYPRETVKKSPLAQIHFHGNFIPLQGIERIIEAASILRNEALTISIVGAGQDFKKIEAAIKDQNLTEKVKLLGQQPFEKIPEYIAAADICLGIFGDTEKTTRVIPNKIYEYMAMGKPIITANTPALRELLTDGKDVLCCRTADGKDLAEKILFLVRRSDVRAVLTRESYTTFTQFCTPKVIIETLLRDLTERALLRTP